jgi:hypothetical protein
MYKVIIEYVVGHPVICISFIFCRQPVGILEEHGLLYFPVTRGGSLPMQSALDVRNTRTGSLDIVPPWQESLRKVRVLLVCRLKNRLVSSMSYYTYCRGNNV